MKPYSFAPVTVSNCCHTTCKNKPQIYITIKHKNNNDYNNSLEWQRRHDNQKIDIKIIKAVLELEI